MPGRYTISQLACAAQVAPSTLRYYERVGLLKPEGRSEGNYRLYSDQSLRKLQFIRAAQAVGFTLDDLQELLRAPGTSAEACRQVQTLIEERLIDIAQRLKDLRHVQRVLQSALAQCRRHERSGVCHVLQALHEQTR